MTDPIASQATPAAPAAPAPAPPSPQPPDPAQGTPPVQDPQPPTDPNADPEIQDPDSGHKGRRSVVQELIHTRKRAQAAELEIARLRGQMEGVRPPEQVPTAPTTPPASQPPVAPNVNAFEKYEDYEKAQNQYLVDKAKYEIRKENEEVDRRRQAEESQRRWQSKVAQAAGKYDDFFEAVNSPAFVQSNAIAFLIKESEAGPDVAYFLAKNPLETARLNSLPPHMAAIEFGKLEARITAPPAQPEPRNIVSQAPAPMTQVTTRGAQVTDEQDLPVEDYIRQRNAKEIARKRGRAA